MLMPNRLANRLVVNEPKYGGVVVAAGPIMKQPATEPHRWVIVHCNDRSFSVHIQVFNCENLSDDLAKDCESNSHSSLVQGHYFKSDAFEDAVRVFGEKLVSSSVYVPAMYRNIP
jgi:hypothetical protein